MSDVNPPAPDWVFNVSHQVYPAVAGGSHAWRSFRCVECGYFESAHEGPGLTVERIADGLRDLWNDPTAGDGALDVAVFSEFRVVVALIRRQGASVVDEPFGELPSLPPDA